MNNRLTKTQAGLLCNDARVALGDIIFNRRERDLPHLLKAIICNEAWRRQQHDGQLEDPQYDGLVVQFESFADMITARRVGGWGLIPEDVRALIEHDPEAVALFDEAINGEVVSTYDRSNEIHSWLSMGRWQSKEATHWILCWYARRTATQLMDGLEKFPVSFERLIRAEAWRRFKFDSLHDLVVMPGPVGWNRDPSEIEAALQGNPKVLAMFRKAMALDGIYSTSRVHDDA